MMHSTISFFSFFSWKCDEIAVTKSLKMTRNAIAVILMNAKVIHAAMPSRANWKVRPNVPTAYAVIIARYDAPTPNIKKKKKRMRIVIRWIKWFRFTFQLRQRGVICRDTRNDCDIPEYCTGDSGLCPKDVYKKNGNVCGQVKSALGEVIGKLNRVRGICHFSSLHPTIIWRETTTKTFVRTIYSTRVCVCSCRSCADENLLKLTKQRTTSHSFWWHETLNNAGTDKHTRAHKTFANIYFVCGNFSNSNRIEWMVRARCSHMVKIPIRKCFPRKRPTVKSVALRDK